MPLTPSFRTEHDNLGELPIPADALWGIHTARSRANFPLSGRAVHPALIHAFGAVKYACARTNLELGHLTKDKAEALMTACREMEQGQLDQHVITDALQGGAGTSTNMAVNEVLANRALQILGRKPGDTALISPLDHVNQHQSTNDTYPTALKIAAIRLLRALDQAVTALQEAFQAQERATQDVVTVGRTEYQDAVLTTMGRRFGAWAEAMTRDRWRISKCEERLRVINLGGTAIGTGLGAPRRYIFRVCEVLRSHTGLGLARAENLVENTQNCDAFAEVAGILTAHAASLIKICGDLRFLSSGPDAGIGELRLPPLQAGSSIMPGKVNPVVPEAVTQVAMQVIGTNSVIVQAAAAGHLELNAFLPLIADNLLTNLDLLERANRILSSRCIETLEVDRAHCAARTANATSMVTALVGPLGYEQAAAIAKRATAEGLTIRVAALASGQVTAEQFDAWVAPAAVTQLGHS